LEKTNGKGITQHRRSKTAVLKASPCTEPLKELREDILRQSCPLLREEQGIMRLGFSRTQPIPLQVDRQRRLAPVA
jgi:hypothetical protein